MSLALRPYPSYKDSGLPWLGDIPTHWEVRRNGRLFAQRTETGFSELSILEVSLRTGVRVRDLDNSTRKQQISDRDRYKRACRGDIVYNMMRLWQGAVGVAPVEGLASPAYVVARPYADVATRFYSYLFRTAAYMNEVNKYSRGIVSDRNRLYWAEFKQMPSAYPPPDEQRAAVEFLDAHERLIHRFIRAERRQISLLNEQKQAIIHQAVTRGLDPNVPLKPSGVEWLGHVPEHWTATRLKYAAKVQTGVTLGKNYGTALLETRPYLRVANVQDGFLDLKDIANLSVPTAEAALCELHTGDVLMTEGGDIDKLGRGYVWRGEIPGCLHQNHIFAVRADRNVLLPEYLALMMTSIHGRTYFQLTAKQTTNLASTNTSTLKAFPVVLPPVAEQMHVLDFIAEEGASVDAAIADSVKQIDLVREYHTRLIADVVTGKLDVRGVELQAVDEVDEVVEWDEGEDDLVDDVNDTNELAGALAAMEE